MSPAPAAGPRPRPRILLLIDGMASITDGGTERQLLQQAALARRAGLDPTIAVLRGTRWLTPEAAGCAVRLGSFHSLRSAQGWRELVRLAAWMRRERFDIVQTFFTDANLLGPILGRLAGAPAILGTRRSLNPVVRPDQERSGRVGVASAAAGLLRRISQSCLTRVITNAEAVSANILATERLRADRLTVVYNGVDLEHLRAVSREELRASVRKSLHLDPDAVLVGNVSGLRPVKRLDLFVRAAAKAVAAAPELRFVLVGEGAERAGLEALIAELGLGAIVWLAGAAEDVRPWLAAFDVGLLCSEAEGFSNSILEYMAAGLPVIATEVGGNREALGAAGYLVPSGEIEALAEAMVRLAGPGERERLGRLAVARVERFSLAEAERQMASVYRSHCPRLDDAGAESRSAPDASLPEIFPAAAEQTARDMHVPEMSCIDDSCSA